MTYFIVDCEATGKTPYSGELTEFGVVELMTLTSFYGKLWDSKPSKENPAVPVLTGDRYDAMSVMSKLTTWLKGFEGPYVFVSDNPAFDFMWVAYEYDRCGFINPFGHSARRIGDYAAGLSEVWTKTSAWKRLRETPHTHDPVDDARGNAEALRALLDIS